jgi:hypothetical protein
MNNTNELLLLSLKEFYSRTQNITKFLSIINGTSKLSLRLIDWYVTNYSKVNRDTYIINDETMTQKHLNIYQSYRSQLKAYKKIKFDPFRRRQRITFIYNQKEEIQTTIGQLNFFKWAIENKIIEYIQKHFKILEDNMNTFQKNQKIKKEEANIQCISKIYPIIKSNNIIIQNVKSSTVSFD